MSEKLKARRDEEGFTLIELLIVIVILAILAAIVVFAVGTTGKNASVAACQSTVKSVETAVEAYKAQVGTFPATITTLTGTKNVNGQTVGPWLRTAPATSTHYKIALGTTGAVLVTAPGNATPPATTTKTYDAHTTICTQAKA